MKKTKADIQLAKAIKDFDEYLETIKTGNPTKPTQLQIQTSTLLSALAHSVQDIKKSINTQTIVMTVVLSIGFTGLGILFSI